MSESDLTVASPPQPKSKPRPLPPSSSRKLLILTLRYVVSAKEYGTIRRRIISKGPKVLRSSTPTRGEFDEVTNSTDLDDYLPAATRAGIRMFLLSNVLLNSWELVTTRLKNKKGSQSLASSLRSMLLNKSNFLSSLSLSVLIIVHRVLYRFFYQLRANLSLPQAKTFRVKYPKASRLFLSPYSPSITASIAGFALAIHPKMERRVTISAYALVKAMEFYYNRLEDKGYFQDRPWWFGSWLLFPLTSGQLLYSFIFDRDCFPEEYGSFIMNYSQEYVQPRPANFPAHLSWPDTSDIVDSIGKVAALRYPPFSSPILFPDSSVLPTTLSAISPIVSPAHPTITSLQCALLHPSEPSCLKTYIHFWASELPRVIKFLAAIYSIAWIPRYNRFLAHPITALTRIAQATGRTSLFITGSIGTAWAANCFFQKLLPRTLLPKGRFYLAGILGGMWAVADKNAGRANFLYSFRIFLVSAWKVLVKKGYVRSIKNGDVLLFVMALAAINCVYDLDANGISSSAARKVLSSLRGRGMRDYVAERRQLEDEKAREAAKGMGKTVIIK